MPFATCIPPNWAAQLSNGQQQQCIRLAAGFANLPHVLSILMLFFFNFTLLCANIVMLVARHRMSSQAIEQIASEEATGVIPPGDPDLRTDSRTSQDNNSLQHDVKSVSGTIAKDIHDKEEIPSIPPPEYTSDTSSHESEPQNIPNPFLDPTKPPPSIETRTFVNATVLLVLHFIIIIVCGFIISRLLYCPPDATTEAFPGAILWIVYAVHITLLLTRLGYWFEALGDLYPQNRRPTWARAIPVWYILLLPLCIMTVPLIAGYSWSVGWVERWRLRLHEGKGEEVGLQEIGKNIGWFKTKGRYQKIRQEIDPDAEASLQESYH